MISKAWLTRLFNSLFEILCCRSIFPVIDLEGIVSSARRVVDDDEASMPAGQVVGIDYRLMQLASNRVLLGIV